VKTIVKSAKYPVDNMPFLWKTITLFHKDEVPEIIKLAQYALTLPLHTCSQNVPKEKSILGWKYSVSHSLILFGY
jgi:uncharacterized protein involved in tolerance to divalent cations